MHQLLARFPAAISALLAPPSALRQLAEVATTAAMAAEAAGSAGPGGSADAAGTGAAADAAAAAESRLPSAAPGPVALVFGREESGLLESELLLCSHACAIPTGANGDWCGATGACNWQLVRSSRRCAERNGLQLPY